MKDAPLKYIHDGHKYIVGFFRLLCGFVLLMLLLLFLLRVNDTVSFNEGEILSVTPQTDYKAPFESRLASMKVKPGQRVNKGDTMLILQNEENSISLAKERSEKQRLEQSLISINRLLQTVQSKSSSIRAESGISSSSRQIEENNIRSSIRSLEEQYALQQQKLASAKERNKADSILYSKDMISRMEYNAGKDITRDIQESLLATATLLNKQRADINANVNNYQKENQSISQRRMDAQQEQQLLIQQKTDTENRLSQCNENIQLLEYNISQQYIVAAINGTVNTVFNTSQASNIISKDELLVSLSPGTDNFYAKAYIPEKEIHYLRNNMEAHIKLDAYYHLEYGILKGSLTYISERKENNKFYALIQLEKNTSFNLKPGYSIYGEIVTERLPLYKFFFRKIFKDAGIKQAQS
ncbi:MAG TPA: HlyD family efflux transporter periplasmic adaptor subunit [Parafilimonas sp.]|nr:HlyD family efflux transporter periplasmic adaptor subunit [Parafilimonas sp.]